MKQAQVLVLTSAKKAGPLLVASPDPFPVNPIFTYTVKPFPTRPIPGTTKPFGWAMGS